MNEGYILGIVFMLLLFGIPLMLWYFSDNRKRLNEWFEKWKEDKDEELRCSTRIPSPESSEVTVVDRPGKTPEIKVSMKPCSHLSRLSSVMVKCPHCQREFIRSPVRIGGASRSGVESLKTGGMSFTEEFSKGSTYPSVFNCPIRSKTIARSREPSGMCLKYNKRVRGEKLFHCMLNNCRDG